MSTVNVRSIDALEELQSALIRYADQTQATLGAVQREVQRTLDWLEERVRHWQSEVRRCQEETQRARAAYERCMASGDRDHPPSCGYEEQAIYAARRRLAQAEAEARMAVQAEAEGYQREARRLRALVQNDTPKAVETLRQKVTVLRSYASGGVSAGGIAAGALAFGAGLAIGAAISAMSGREDADKGEATGQTPAFAEGSEPPLQMLHPEIRVVRIDQIDLSDSPVYDEGDFHKVSHAEMVEGLTKLRQVQQWIEQGATDQMLREIDDAQGLTGAQGYHNIYLVFYGDSPIKLDWVDGRYQVINGYHRLAVAKELGLTTIPARVGG